MLVLCKMDLIIADIGKDCYARFSQQIAAIHDTVEAHSVVGDKGGAGKGGGSQATACRPEDGGVIFCSAPHSWAFTLQDFAEQYAVKFGVATGLLSASICDEGRAYFLPSEVGFACTEEPTCTCWQN